MKDLHSHLLPGIDDGSKSIEETITLLKKASEEGITDLVLTPHYIEMSKYNCNNDDKLRLLKIVQEEASKENININLYLGNEVYLTENFLELLKNNEIMTINNSRYLLLEFPLGNMFRNTKEILYELIVSGYIPIIAHPERYRIFQRHPEHMEEYLRMGVLLQGNYKSLLGKYGKDAKHTLKYFLKKGWICLIGSDCHHEENFEIKKMKRKLNSIVKDEQMIADILENNFVKIITNEEIGIRR